ncbi:MAG: hypothetical protein AAGN46_04980, partial [Acidobacteriota bacterium]
MPFGRVATSWLWFPDPIVRRHRLARWRLGVAWATVVAGVSLVACQGPQPLRAGHEVELRLAPNDRVVYNVDVPRSTVVRLVVEQQGLDVMLTVDARPSVDLPFGDRVDEELWWLASAGESLDVEIASLGGEGTARLRVELQPATEELRAQVAGFWDLQRGLEHLGAARVGPAAADFDRALAKPAVDRASWRPVAMAALGRAELRSGRAAEAISTLQQVLALLGASGRESTAISEQAQAALAARVALDLGIGHSELGNHAEAQRALSKAEGQARRADDAYGVALALDQQGVLADAQGDLDQAIERLDAAVDLFSDLGAARQRTMARLHLARCQMKLGAMSAARQILDEEWARRDDLDRFLRARLFQDLGWWHRLEGEAAPARDLLLQALEIDPTSVALLDRLGTVHLDLGEVEAARAFYARAADGIGDRRHWQAHLDGNLCRLERLAGHAEKALGLCRGALDAFAASGAVGSEAAMATRSAEILSELDQLWAAEAMASRAVDLLEKQRLESTGGDRRSTFLSVRLEAYRLLIDLRMRLHADRPDEGWDRRALEIFELTRARRLRDVLAAQQVDAANELPAPAGVETLRALLDPGTAFVFVHLGHRRSVLWKLAATGLESHLLPSQEVIEAAARAWSVLLTDSLRAGSWNRRLERRRAAHLASMLFDPLGVGSATERRWVLVVDGALQRVPFAALPSPFGDERPLLSDVETVQLPSASTLAALRSLTAGRAPARELLAIVADPVYGLDDVRAAVWTNRSAAGPRDPARAPEPL